jgi:hypothetical protein
MGHQQLCYSRMKTVKPFADTMKQPSSGGCFYLCHMAIKVAGELRSKHGYLKKLVHLLISQFRFNYQRFSNTHSSRMWLLAVTERNAGSVIVKTLSSCLKHINRIFL